jgi:translation initiation factor IF-3
VGLNGQAEVVPILEALRRAQEAGYDLVEINAASRPPVCKIMDYGKYKFQQEKKAKEAAKKQKVFKIKEIQLRPHIEKHDLDFKMKSATGFLQEGDKVKVVLMFKGREIQHIEIGDVLMRRVIEILAPFGVPERNVMMEGRSMIAVFMPVKKSHQQQPQPKKESNDAQTQNK